MSKVTIFIAIIASYFFYSQVKNINSTLAEIKKDNNNILVVSSLLRDKLDIKEKEVELKQFEINKMNANFEAFNGTACMRCHLDTAGQLPLKKHDDIDLERYIKVVRDGIPNVMPSYINSPKKGANDITDSELRRQYKILKPFYEKQLMLNTKSESQQ